MTDTQRLVRENTSLKARVAELEARIAELEAELRFLKTHPTIAQGIKGETLVAKLTGGAITAYAADHDVAVQGTATVEVKFSKINSPYEGAITQRWNWSKLLGWQDKGKGYDFLLLIGDKDPRFLSQYPNDGSPYVFFLIPSAHVPSVLSKGATIGSQAQINTNLETARSSASKAIKKFMVPATLVSSVIEQIGHTS
jgi:hypothetical protein